MSIIQDILSGIGIYWEDEKDKINANFAALNADKVEIADVPTKTSDLVNDSDFVADADYVATDNNFTDAEKSAIVDNTAKRSYPLLDETRLADTSGTNTGDQDLSDYATTSDMTTALANKVDKDGAKVLTDVNFSSSDKVLVDTIEDKQPKQTGYGLSQNNYSDDAASKVSNLPINTVTSLAGKADLDGDDLVLLTQLPDSVKNAGILQYDSLGNFPLLGNTSLIYLARDTNIMYRWSGTEYLVVATSDIDIVGTDEIADDLIDTDLLLVNDVSVSENKSLLISRIWTYIQAKLAALTTLTGWASVLDEDDMVSDDDTKIATQQSIKAYVDNANYQNVLLEGAFVDGDKTKLDGIETAADVTDSVNVNAAGATMDADTDISANAWVLDEDDLVSDDATKVPTQQSVKAYVDNNSGSGLLDKLDATVDPSATDDSSAGYVVGSKWVNVSADSAFICVDDTVGAAVWQSMTASAVGWDGDITDMNISGGTDIGEDFQWADMFVVEDYNSGEIRKSNISRIWTYISSVLASGAGLLNGATLKDYGATISNITSSGGSLSIDPEDGNIFTITLNENITSISLSGSTIYPALKHITLLFQQDATGGRTITWPTSFKWAGGTAPTISTTANAVDIINIFTFDEGTTWYCSVEGANFS